MRINVLLLTLKASADSEDNGTVKQPLSEINSTVDMTLQRFMKELTGSFTVLVSVAQTVNLVAGRVSWRTDVLAEEERMR